MVRLKQTLAPLLVVAVSFFQPFCEAAESPRCIYEQSNAVKNYVKCAYSFASLAKCRKTFTRVWLKLTRPQKGRPPVCYKAYPPSQSVVSAVNSCTQAYFKEEKCHELTEHFLDLAHDEDKIVCDKDKKHCPDGSYVGRDPENDCKFEDCPIIGCKIGLRKCPDGTIVYRNPKNDCEFDPCCCLEKDYIYCGYGDAECCTDGEWACPNKVGRYECENKWIKGPFGKECK